MLKQALNYSKKGFTVIPCRGKIPIIKWRDFQYKKPTNEEITKWWEKYPQANISVVVGESKNLTVIDCDSEEVYVWLQENYFSESMITPVVKSPHGYHLYFKFAPGLSSKRYIDNLDVKTDGGVLVVPPSKVNGTNYTWLVSPAQTSFSEIPQMLLDYLQEVNNHYSSFLDTSKEKTTTNDHSDHKRPQLFSKGSRDNDLFHIANCLIKGGCSREKASNVLEILAKNCKPTFSEKEVPIKIESALQRANRRDKNISEEVREWVLTTTGHFLTTDNHKELNLTTSDHKKAANMALLRLVDEGIIEKHGEKRGSYRLIDQNCRPIDWINADGDPAKIWLPFELSNLANDDGVTETMPGDIILFAGTPNVGKTGILMNIAKENRHKWIIHYISSELSNRKFKKRFQKDSEVTIDMLRDILFYDLTQVASKNFQDFIKPGEGNLNIIDYLESLEEPWKMGVLLDNVFRRLKGAVAVVAIQKKPGSETGYGGEYTKMRPALVINLEHKRQEMYNQAVITKCKEPSERFIEERGGPEWMKYNFNLVNGIKIIRKSGWHR